MKSQTFCTLAWLPHYGKDIGPIFCWVRLFDENNYQLIFLTIFAVKCKWSFLKSKLAQQQKHSLQPFVFREKKIWYELHFDHIQTDHTTPSSPPWPTWPLILTLNYQTLPKAQRIRGLSSGYQSDFLRSYQSSYTNQISSSESRPSTNLKISTKHKHLDKTLT